MLNGKKHIIIASVILFGVIAIFTMLYFQTGMFGVDGDSMYPTLNNGDLLLVSRTDQYAIGDIVIIDSSDLKKDIVKRIVGLPGDYIEITKKGLFRNRSKVTEEYVSREKWFKDSIKVSVTVPANSVYVLGDNRGVSLDSRELGAIPMSQVYGTLIVDISNYTGLSATGSKVVFAFVFLLLLFFMFVWWDKIKGATVIISQSDEIDLDPSKNIEKKLVQQNYNKDEYISMEGVSPNARYWDLETHEDVIQNKGRVIKE